MTMQTMRELADVIYGMEQPRLVAFHQTGTDYTIWMGMLLRNAPTNMTMNTIAKAPKTILLGRVRLYSLLMMIS